MSTTAQGNVVHFLEEQVRARPQAIALCVPEGMDADGKTRYRRVDFTSLGRRVLAADHFLRSRGVSKGERVLIMVPPGEALIALVYALFRRGAVPVVIDPGMGLKAFLNAVKRTRPTVLLGIPIACAVSFVFLRTFSSVRLRVPVGKNFVAGLEQISLAQGTENAEPCQPEDLAAILFTSGSTGAPKGVCCTHRILAEQVRALRDVFGVGQGERDFPMLPVFSLFNPALGSTTIVPQINPSRPARADAAALVAAIVQEKATMSFGSPVLWAKVCRYCLDNGIVLDGLRRILSAGAPVPVPILRQMAQVAPHALVQTPYGATEALPVAVISGETVLRQTWQATEAGKGTCVGLPVGSVRVIIIPIVDKPIACLSDTVILPPEQIGEICVSGDVVTETYDHLPEATARAKIRGEDGTCWHRMGDAGYVDAQGRIWFCGRVVERVELPGQTLFTDNCEAVFNGAEGVFRTGLLGLDLPEGKTAALAVEPLPGHWPRTRVAQVSFAQKLHKIAIQHAHTQPIRRFYFVKAFPVDVRHNAKIHRLRLAKQCMRNLPQSVCF